MNKLNKTTMALALVALGSLLSASADLIPIPNPGFEQLAKNEGQDDYNRWANASDVWRHWTRTENGGPLRIWNPGDSGASTFQGVLEYGFGGNAPEGNNVQLIYSRYSFVPGSSLLEPAPQWDGVNYFSAACLLLDGTIGNPPASFPAAPFAPTKVYKLTATVGKPPVFVTNSGPQYVTDPRRAQAAVWHGYALQLAVGGTNSVGSATFAGRVDGGTIVAQDSNSRVVPVDGFRTVTTTYFPNPADAGLTGKYLQVRLASLDNPADVRMTGYVAFDDVKLEEFAAPTLAYWDRNGTDPGAGGAAPSGTWDGASTFWNAVADGTGSTAAWTGSQTAVFAAGTDASGTYNVTVDGTQDIGGLAFEEGTVTLTGGTALRLTGIAMVDVTNGLTATVATPITEDVAGRQLAKTGAGTLVLSGSNTYSGGITVLGGNLRLGANDVLDDASPVTLSGWSAGTSTLDLAGNSDTIGGLILGGSTPSSGASVTTGAGTLTLGGDVAYLNASGTGANPLGATISGKLDLGVTNRTFLVNDSAPAADDLTVAADISGTNALTKAGKGTLVLSGNNVAATGGLSLGEGVTRFESAGAINGTARDVTVTTPGAVVFAPSFGAGNIPTALANRIVASSDGIIAADNYAATGFDFSTAGLTNAYLGAVGAVTYTGTLTPGGTTYRLGGGGGTLTIPGANALTGAGNSLNVGGKVTLTAANSYGGGTVLFGGTVFPASPVVLTLGDSGSLGTGPLTIQAAPNASTTGTIQSSDSSARNLTNVIVLEGGLNVAGAGDFNFTDTTPINLSATRLFVIGNPVTRFAQAFTGSGFGITMDYTGAGTLILAGTNSYTAVTTVNGGTLVLTGDNSATTGGVTVSSRFGVPSGVVLGHDNALGSGTLTIGAVPATVAAQGSRTIANAIAANADFAIVGTDPLTLGGTMTLSANRNITNNNTTSTTTLGYITGANRNLTFHGNGNTTVTINIETGTGQLIKNGAGTLTLSGFNTYAGNTTIRGGTLALGSGGSIAITPQIDVQTSANFDVSAVSGFTLDNAQTLKGNGTVIGPVVVNNGTVSPGASVGTLSSGSQTWNGGGAYKFELSSAVNSTGWDRLNITGTLDVQATSGYQFTVKLVSMASTNTAGLVPDFSDYTSYTWVLATATGGITNFDASAFVFDASAFTNAYTGTFSVGTNGNSLVVKYTALPLVPPTLDSFGPLSGGSFPLTFSGPSGQPYKVLTSTNVALPMASWKVLTSGSFGAGPVTYTDMNATNATQFYRIKSP